MLRHALDKPIADSRDTCRSERRSHLLPTSTSGTGLCRPNATVVRQPLRREIRDRQVAGLTLPPSPAFMRMICSRIEASSPTDSIEVSEKTRMNPSPDLMYIECSAMNCERRVPEKARVASVSARPSRARRWQTLHSLTNLFRARRVHDVASDRDTVDGDNLPIAVLDGGVVLLDEQGVHEPHRERRLADTAAAPARRGKLRRVLRVSWGRAYTYS